MPRHDDIRIESYLEVFESALLDHYLSRHEEEALVAMAEELSLSRQLLDEIHREYLRSMATIAVADGVVTDDERADLLQVAELIGLTPNQVDTALATAPVRQACAEFAFAPGDVLCLTGAMRRPPVGMGGGARRARLRDRVAHP